MTRRRSRPASRSGGRPVGCAGRCRPRATNVAEPDEARRGSDTAHTRFRAHSRRRHRQDRLPRASVTRRTPSSVQASFRRGAALREQFADPVASPRPVQLSTFVARIGVPGQADGHAPSRLGALHSATSLIDFCSTIRLTDAAREARSTGAECDGATRAAHAPAERHRRGPRNAACPGRQRLEHPRRSRAVVREERSRTTTRSPSPISSADPRRYDGFEGGRCHPPREPQRARHRAVRRPDVHDDFSSRTDSDQRLCNRRSPRPP